MPACADALRGLCMNEPLKTNGTIGSKTQRWLAKYHLCPPNGGTTCLKNHRDEIRRCLASRTSCASRCAVARPSHAEPVSNRFFAELAAEVTAKLADHRSGGSCFVNRLPRNRVPPAAASLIDGLSRPSCAVVGNSPLVLTQSAGRAIDRHDVVIRFNFAPTRGFERHVGAKTSVRFMGKSWVWSEPPGAAAGGTGGISDGGASTSDPVLMHRYNSRTYFDEDLQLNGGFNIATLDHPFQLHGFGMARRVKKALTKRSNATTKFTQAEREGLSQRYGSVKSPLAPISSGFSGVLFAMYACSDVSVYGFDLLGEHPGHYFNDTRDGVVARLAELRAREPRRTGTFSVDPGLHGTSKVEIIREQYTDEEPEHPFQLERGLIRAWRDSGCLTTDAPSASPSSGAAATLTVEDPPSAARRNREDGDGGTAREPLVVLRPGLRCSPSRALEHGGAGEHGGADGKLGRTAGACRLTSEEEPDRSRGVRES